MPNPTVNDDSNNNTKNITSSKSESIITIDKETNKTATMTTSYDHTIT